MADLHRTAIGDLMARIVGDVEVLGVGVREFTIEIWDTVLFSLSFVVAMLVIDPGSRSSRWRPCRSRWCSPTPPAAGWRGGRRARAKRTPS